MKIVLIYYKSPLIILICLILLTAGQNTRKEVDGESVSFEGDIGHSVTLHCPSVVNQSFKVTWTLDCGNESLNHHHHYKDRVQFTENNLEMTIPNLTAEDSRIYFCNMENITHKLHRKIQLSVTQKPDSTGVDTDNDPNIQTYILYGVIALQTFVVCVLLAFVIRRPHTAVTSGSDEMVKEEIQYVEIHRKNKPQQSRIREAHEQVIYSPVKSSNI